MGYAMNTRNAAISYHNLRGQFKMNLNLDGRPSFPCTQRCPKPKKAHGNKKERYTLKGKNLGPGFFLQASQRNGLVTFKVELPVNSYIGFTLGKKSMKDVDMVVFKNVNGYRFVEDHYGRGYGPTVKDPEWE